MKRRMSAGWPQFSRWVALWSLCFIMFLCLFVPVLGFAADRLIVKNGSGTTTFTVEDSGATRIASSLVTNGAAGVGTAPFVLGQESILDGMWDHPMAMQRYSRSRKVLHIKTSS